jgi:hypothetical protein
MAEPTNSFVAFLMLSRSSSSVSARAASFTAVADGPQAASIGVPVSSSLLNVGGVR